VPVGGGGGREEGRLLAGVEEAFADDEVVGREVQGARFWPLEREDAPPRAGKGFDFEEEEVLLVLPWALPQLPWRETAEREDCAVEDLRRRTLRPPGWAPPESPSSVPVGPGRLG